MQMTSNRRPWISDREPPTADFGWMHEWAILTYHTVTWLKICASYCVSRRCIEPTWCTGVAARPVAVAVTLGGARAPTPVA